MRSHSKGLFAVAALFALLLVPSSALAGKPVNDYFGATGTGDGQFANVLGGLAVNQSTGDLYAFDPANSRVQRFDAEGNYISQFGEAGSGNGQFDVSGDLVPVPQIAIDQADGSVYVADWGNDRIQKFEADGTFVAVIDSATGSAISETFSNPRGVAVGTDGTLYVADTGNDRIAKFDSSGAYLSDLGIAVGEFEGELSNPVGLAVDSTGAIYVHEAVELAGRVQKFSAAGTYEYSLIVGEQLNGATTDTTNDHVFVAGRQDIYELSSTGELLDTHHVDPAGASLNAFTSLAVKDGGGPIYGANLNGDLVEGTWILILEEPGIPGPSATIDPVTSFDTDSASFSGVVNPNGRKDANWHFVISPAHGSVSAGGTAAEGTTPEVVNGEVAGLEPSTTYEVSLVASKFFVTEKGIATMTFTTDPVAPVIEALDPGPVTHTSAWIGGYIDPRNAPTTYYIEYSTDPSFSPASSTRIPASEDASAGSGGEPVFVNAQLKELSPQTPYHYRVVATNVAGAVTGESRSFTTDATPSGPPPAGLPDGRVWEKVSPADKGGAGVKLGKSAMGPSSRAAADGDAVAFLSTGKFGEEAFDGDSGAVVSQYLARRGPDGWTTKNVDPPVEPGIVAQVSGVNGYSWFSGDLSKGIVTTTANFLPGDVDNVFQLYLRDNLTETFSTVSNADESTPKEAAFIFRGATANADHVVFRLGAGTAEPNQPPLLERLSSGEVRPVSVLPNGTVVPGNIGTSVAAGAQFDFAGFNPISRDGTKIFFSPSFSSESSIERHLYLREDGESTTLVSASERAGDDPTIPHKAQFLGASRDGSIAYFTSTDKLTNDAVAGCAPLSPSSPVEVCISDLYRWDGRAPLGDRLTDITAATPGSHPLLGLTGLSDDGSSAYIVTGGPGGPDLRLWREGEEIQTIARLSEADKGIWSKVGGGPPSTGGPEVRHAARVTPDGSQLAFTSVRPQTGYDTDGKNQLYLYDSDEDRIVCVSCGTFSAKSKGHSWFRGCIGEGQSGSCGDVEIDDQSRNLRPDGTRLVFDSKDALVPEDTNGVIDVYQWSEGELSLISSGTSGFASKFLDASEDGDDIFFTTSQQLVASDKDDLVDLYDARVGGMPEPPIDQPCVADECQGTPTPPPTFGTPSSSSFHGKGNASAAKPRCRKGKVRRKGRCVARKARKQRAGKQSKQRAKGNRRAGR